MRREHDKISQTGPDEHTLLLLTGDDFVDHSLYNHSVTNTNVTLSDTCKYNKSFYFGGNAKLNTDIGDKKITDGKFTLEMWLNLQSTSGYKCVADFCNHSTMYFDAADSRDGTLVLMNGSASWQAAGSYMCQGIGQRVTIFNTNNWHHVAIVGNDNGHDWLYLDGVKLTSGAWSYGTNVMNMANGKIQFGNINYGNLSRYFQGYMEEIRLSNIVRYTDNFTPQSLR